MPDTTPDHDQQILVKLCDYITRATPTKPVTDIIYTCYAYAAYYYVGADSGARLAKLLYRLFHTQKSLVDNFLLDVAKFNLLNNKDNNQL